MKCIESQHSLHFQCAHFYLYKLQCRGCNKSNCRLRNRGRHYATESVELGSVTTHAQSDFIQNNTIKISQTFHSLFHPKIQKMTEQYNQANEVEPIQALP